MLLGRMKTSAVQHLPDFGQELQLRWQHVILTGEERSYLSSAWISNSLNCQQMFLPSKLEILLSSRCWLYLPLMCSEHQLSALISPHSAETHCECYQEGSQEKVPHQEIWLSSKLVPVIKKNKTKLQRNNDIAVFCEKGQQTSNLQTLGTSTFRLKASSQLAILRSLSPHLTVWCNTSYPCSRTINTDLTTQTHIVYYYKGLKLLLFISYLIVLE